MNLLDALVTVRDAAESAAPHPTLMTALGVIDVRIAQLQSARSREWDQMVRAQRARDGVLRPEWILWHASLTAAAPDTLLAHHPQ